MKTRTLKNNTQRGNRKRDLRIKGWSNQRKVSGKVTENHHGKSTNMAYWLGGLSTSFHNSEVRTRSSVVELNGFNVFHYSLLLSLFMTHSGYYRMPIPLVSIHDKNQKNLIQINAVLEFLVRKWVCIINPYDA